MTLPMTDSQSATVSKEQAMEALDTLDDFARMNCGVDAYESRETLRRFISQAEEWIPVSERLPEKREKPYQVIALCVKRYKEMCYAGEPIRGIYQDWVLRNWPQNYTYWMPLAPIPTQDHQEPTA